MPGATPAEIVQEEPPPPYTAFALFKRCLKDEGEGRESELSYLEANFAAAACISILGVQYCTLRKANIYLFSSSLRSRGPLNIPLTQSSSTFDEFRYSTKRSICTSAYLQQRSRAFRKSVVEIDETYALSRAEEIVSRKCIYICRKLFNILKRIQNFSDARATFSHFAESMRNTRSRQFARTQNLPSLYDARKQRARTNDSLISLITSRRVLAFASCRRRSHHEVIRQH